MNITQYQVPLSAGGTAFSPRFWKGQNLKKEMSAWEDLKSSCDVYLRGGACYVSCQKELLKIKYGSKGLISNVDIGLFWPNSQLMFSVVTFWFC